MSKARDPRQLVLVAMAGSAALLGGALVFQYFGGLAPCKMCIWQRWPHGIALALGVLWLMRPSAGLLALAALVVLIGAGIGGYHSGVELGIFEGPDSCTSGPIADVSTDQLLEQILSAPVVRCDEVAWAFLGLSMAGWNALLSVGLALIWLAALRKR